MSEFNPYQQWLGISGSAKPTYYQLLGVDLFEGDEQIIRENAKQRIALLNGLATGDREPSRQEILRRIQRAVSCLTDENKKLAYDSDLTKAVARKRKREKSTRRQTVITPVPAPQRPAGLSHAVSVGPVRKNRVIAHSLKKSRERSKLLFASGLILMAVAAVGLFQIGREFGWFRSSVREVDVTPPSIARSTMSDSPREDASVAMPTTGDPIPQNLLAAEPNVELESSVVSPEPVDVTNAELMEVGELLKRARLGLGERDVALARDLLEQASMLLKRNADKDKHRRLTQLADYVEEYWAAADEGFVQLKAGYELEVKATRVMVVEKTADSMLLRVNGRNVTYQRKDLPLGLATALADRWLNPSAPSTLVLRGAMMAATPGFSTEESVRLWRRAEASGQVQLGDLIQVIDDSYDLQL